MAKSSKDNPVIYLCVGDMSLRTLLTDGLTHRGYKAEPCHTPDEALRAAAENPGALVFDEGAAGAAADSIAASGMPVVVLAEGGADIASFSFPVLCAPFRLGALLDLLAAGRAANPAHARIVAIGPYRLDTQENALIADGKNSPIRLTEKERDILLRLHAAEDDIVTRDVLLGDIWGYGQEIETHTLETHIYRLRRKIETDPANPLLLLTEENGYRLRRP